jgi:hypothetical protein
VAGPLVRSGARSPRPVDHYGVLRSIEDTLGLSHLAGAREPGHGDLNGLFRDLPTLP